MDKSMSAHCCFEYTIMDTTKPQDYSDECGQHFDSVCECFTEEDAKLICTRLNADDSHLAAEVERLQGEIKRLKRKQERMCQRKKGHPTKKAADKHILKTHLGEAENMHSYECPYCYMWHVGHKSTSYNGNPSVAVLEQVREARRLIGFMTNEKIAEAARILDAIGGKL